MAKNETVLSCPVHFRFHLQMSIDENNTKHSSSITCPPLAADTLLKQVFSCIIATQIRIYNHSSSHQVNNTNRNETT